MTTKYGVFNEPSYLGPTRGPKRQGLPEDGAEKPPPPAAFRISSSKTGKNNDATFSAFASLHTEDPYKQRQKRSALTGPAFRPAGKWKQDAFAAATEQPPAVPPRKKGDVMHEKRNFVTNPAKKGGFGYVGTTLSERAGARGVVGEYEHAAPFPAGADSTETKERRATDASLTPFRSAVRPQHTVSGAMSDYEWRPRLPQANTEAPSDQESPAPFRPAHSSGGAFSPYPAHESSVPPIGTERRGNRDMQEDMLGRAWIPAASDHSGPTRSIVSMNVV